jgi:hypothetical protein
LELLIINDSLFPHHDPVSVMPVVISS